MALAHRYAVAFGDLECAAAIPAIARWNPRQPIGGSGGGAASVPGAGSVGESLRYRLSRSSWLTTMPMPSSINTTTTVTTIAVLTGP